MKTLKTAKSPEREAASVVDAESPANEAETLSTDATGNDTKKVPLSEEFQLRTLDHLKGASPEELSFVRDQVFKHEEAQRKAAEPTMDDFNSAKA